MYIRVSSWHITNFDILYFQNSTLLLKIHNIVKSYKYFYSLTANKIFFSFFDQLLEHNFPTLILFTRHREDHREFNRSRNQQLSHLNKPCDVLGWIFPFPLLDGGAVGGCGSLADRCTNAGALLACLFIPAGMVPGIISMLELSRDELSVCWSRVKINRMSPAMECSSDDTCRDSWSILAFISSIGRPGPL